MMYQLYFFFSFVCNRQNLHVLTTTVPHRLSSDLGIDVALRMGSLRDSTLTARKLGQCRRLVLATPAYFARAGIPATPAERSAQQAIALAQSNIATAWTFRPGAPEASVSVRGRVRLTAAEAVRGAVRGGLGPTPGHEDRQNAGGGK